METETLVVIIIIETVVLIYLTYFLIHNAGKIMVVINDDNLIYNMYHSFGVQPLKNRIKINNDIESDYHHNIYIRNM